MTYIAACRTDCADPNQRGIVMSADTQETWGDIVTFVEKLSVIRTDAYDLCIGGAGRSELINGFVQLATEQIKDAKPNTEDEFAETLRGALLDFYQNDVALLPGQDDDKEIQFLIAGRSSSGETSLWKTEGIRLFPVADYAVTGHETPFCQYIIGKTYSPSAPLDNAVLASAWLVSIAKTTSTWCGGSSSIITIGSSGIHTKTSDEVANLEEIAKKHDEFFLWQCP